MKQKQTRRIRKDAVDLYSLTDEYLFKSTLKSLVDSLTMEELKKSFKLRKIDSILEPEPNGEMIKWIKYSVEIDK